MVIKTIISIANNYYNLLLVIKFLVTFGHHA